VESCLLDRDAASQSDLVNQIIHSINDSNKTFPEVLQYLVFTGLTFSWDWTDIERKKFDYCLCLFIQCLEWLKISVEQTLKEPEVT
jgi:hypothetical protein